MAAKPRYRYDHRNHRLIPIQELPQGKAYGYSFENRLLAFVKEFLTVYRRENR